MLDVPGQIQVKLAAGPDGHVQVERRQHAHVGEECVQGSKRVEVRRAGKWISRPAPEIKALGRPIVDQGGIADRQLGGKLGITQLAVGPVQHLIQEAACPGREREDLIAEPPARVLLIACKGIEF